jgi:hypothetical protein
MEAASSAASKPSAGWPARRLREIWRGDRWDRLWCIVGAWFFASLAVFMLIGAWSVATFALTFGLLFGALGWKCRRLVRPAMARLRLDNLAGFILLALGISALEEVWCFSFGNKVALPVLWMDVAFCAAVWLPWFLAWRLFLSKRYHFGEKEALLLAASTGLLYELVGSGAIFRYPAGLLLMAPLDIVVYAAIFVLPMQLIDFTGTRTGPGKYLVAPILPYLLAWPVAALFLLFM